MIEKLRRILKVFFTEIVLIFTIGVILISVLVIFKIIDLSAFFPQLNSASSHRINSKELEPEWDVELISEHPGYELSFNNKKAFLMLLNEFSVFGKSHKNSAGSTQNEEVKLVRVILNNKIPEEFKKNSLTKNTSMVIVPVLYPGRIDLVVSYIKRSEAEPSPAHVLSLIMNSLYRLSFDVSQKENTNELSNKISKKTMEYNSYQGGILKITKK